MAKRNVNALMTSFSKELRSGLSSPSPSLANNRTPKCVKIDASSSSDTNNEGVKEEAFLVSVYIATGIHDLNSPVIVVTVVEE